MTTTWKRKRQTLFLVLLFVGFVAAGLLLIDFRDVTAENFPVKMEELVKQINLIKQNKLTHVKSTNETVSGQLKDVTSGKGMSDEE